MLLQQRKKVMDLQSCLNELSKVSDSLVGCALEECQRCGEAERCGDCERAEACSKYALFKNLRDA